MRRLNLVGLSVLAATVVVPHASSMQLRIAPSVTIGGAQVPVEAQLRSVIEQEIGVADRARIRLDGPHGVAFARTIALGEPVDVVAVALDGTSTPVFRGAVSSIDAGSAGEPFIIIEASSAEPAAETALGRSFTVARGSGDARLVDFAPRLAARSSIQGVLITGFLESSGEPITGRAAAPPIPLSADSTQWSGTTLTLETDRRFASIEEANAFAYTTLTNLIATRVSAEVLTDGLTDLKAGSVVDIHGAGERFDGQYYVVGVTHRFGGDSYGGYSTALRVRRADHGMFHHPEIDDEVLVAFEAGNLLRPYLVGSLWDCDAGGRGEPSDGDQRCRLLRWPW